MTKKIAWKRNSCVNPKEFSKDFRLTTLVSYIKCNFGQMCRIEQHKNIDFVFFTCLIVIQDTDVGRLRIKDFDWPETFDAGDAIFIDLRVLHE